jgi:hypothetical protein
MKGADKRLGVTRIILSIINLGIFLLLFSEWRKLFEQNLNSQTNHCVVIRLDQQTYWQLVNGSLQYATFSQLKTSALRVSMVNFSHSAGALVEPCTVMRVRFGTAGVL